MADHEGIWSNSPLRIPVKPALFLLFFLLLLSQGCAPRQINTVSALPNDDHGTIETLPRENSGGGKVITYRRNQAAPIEPSQPLHSSEPLNEPPITETQTIATPDTESVGPAIDPVADSPRNPAIDPAKVIALYESRNLPASPEPLPEAGDTLALQPNEIIQIYQGKHSPSDIAESVQLDAYRLRPGDSIEISVWQEDMTRVLIIPPDGMISYFLIGEIKVTGKTLDEVRREVEERLAEYFKAPRVTVIGKSFAENYVTILGAVKSPGNKVLALGDRVIDVIAKADGLIHGEVQESVIITDLEKAYLSRNGVLLDVDFADLLLRGNMAYNIPMLRGDIIYLPYRSLQNVFAVGEVNRPAAVPYRDQLTLLDAVANAGGFKASAYKNDIFIVRGSLREPQISKKDFAAIIAGKQQNPLLEPGDIVFVPATFIGKLERISLEIIPFLDVILKSKAIF